MICGMYLIFSNFPFQEYSALFIETSAKDGSNILESVTELTRLVNTVGMLIACSVILLSQKYHCFGYFNVL